MNYGIIIEPRKNTDFVAGEVSGIQYEPITDGNWTKHLPSNERQSFRFVDTMACVSYSTLNVIETQLNYYIDKGKLNFETLSFLDDNGFLIDGKIECSDRYLAKMSGTTKKGNSLQKVCDTLRHRGILAEGDWMWNDDFKWDDYYSEIPQDLQAKALRFYDYFEVQYEWVSAGLPVTIEQLKKHLKQAPLQIASSTCGGNWNETVVKKCDLSVNHATMVYNVGNYINDFDSYPRFNKLLSLDYYIPYVMKIIIKPKNPMKSNAKLIKNGQEVIVGLPCTNEEALIDKTMNVGIQLPFTPAGKVDWPKIKYDYEIK